MVHTLWRLEAYQSIQESETTVDSNILGYQELNINKKNGLPSKNYIIHAVQIMSTTDRSEIVDCISHQVGRDINIVSHQIVFGPLRRDWTHIYGTLPCYDTVYQ